MGILGGFVDSAANVFLSTKGKEMANSFIGRYGEVTDIKKEGPKLIVSAKINGSSEILTVTIGKLVFSEDNASLKLQEISASLEGVDNLLGDFVEGKEIPIPEANRGIVDKVKGFFKSNE